MWGYCRAGPAVCASSRRLCAYEISPMGIAKGTDRWWSNPARTDFGPTPRRSDLRHIAAARCQSAPARNRRKCASHGRRWRRPKWSAPRGCGSHVVQLATHRPKASLDIAKALAISQLSERHREILIAAREASPMSITAVARDTLLKLVGWQMVHQLSEDRLTE